MELIGEACGMASSHLAIADDSSGAPDFLFGLLCNNIELPSEEVEREYVRDYFPIDERVPRVLRLPHGRILHNTELYTERERKKTSATWNDFLLRYDAANQLAVRMDGPDGLHIVYVVTRISRQGDWSSAHINLLQRLLPHIRHAVRARQALASAQALGASRAGLLDHPLLGVILLDRRGSVVEASTRAREILRQGDGLSDANGALSALWATDNAALGKLLARALPRFGHTPIGGSIIIRSPSVRPPFRLHVSPVAARQMDFGVRSVAALAWIVDSQAKLRVDPQPVAALLGLTPAQSRVAAAVAEGGTVRGIADSKGLSETTVRWHLKQVFAKTGCSGQPDLVRLVLSLPSVY